jgi:hypothetical protein
MKKFIMLIALCMALGSYAAETMYVNTVDGTTPLALANVADVRFPADGGLVVTHVDSSANTIFDAANFKSVTFDANAASIGNINVAQYGIVFDGVVLTASEPIAIYAIDGVPVMQATKSTIAIADLVPGVYVAKTNTATIKFVKR